MVQCTKQLTMVEQRYEAFQKGLLKFRQNCVVAGITSASLSSIEQCVLALRSSLMADNKTLQVVNVLIFGYCSEVFAVISLSYSGGKIWVNLANSV